MNHTEKVAKLLALARDPAATPGEADTAKRLADGICDKFGIDPIQAVITRGSSGPARALNGNVAPQWQPDWYATQPQPAPRRAPFRIAPESNISGISIEQARSMAMDILDMARSGQYYLDPDEEYLVMEAFDGLLTEFGKILLLGLHAVVVG